MSERGYIRFYRSIFAHPAFRKEAFTEREAWVWLCAKAAWRPIRQRAGEHVVELERGEVVGAVRYLAAEWQWTRGKVDRFLTRLKNEAMIETRTGTGITVITIRNYSDYQGDEGSSGTGIDQKPGQDRDASGTPPGQDRDNRKELNPLRREEGKEGDGWFAAGNGAPVVRADDRSPQLPMVLGTQEVLAPPGPRKTKRTRPRSAISPDWSPSEADWEYARSKGYSDRDIPFQAERFRNHHISRGNLMADWPAAWKTWINNGYGPRGPGGGGGRAPQSRADSAIEGLLSGMREDDFR
ncbi:hypothetical protein OOZ54_12610 [Rhodopseudomonas palustris]|uniref:hypothetical protein n=1 Tax=Rhodopseudomonas palustris TaxID=1076 RepID=UPI0022F13D68|nr:hypothetical protein [Rhodopseudomonas palustris]WBU27536.1 hypothetical protein OOZ54_12610 [Rhodopseudomonas palustris]